MPNTLAGLLEEVVARRPETPIAFVGGETWTAAGLLSRAACVAGAVAGWPGPREAPVLVLVDDLADFLAVFWGLVWAGRTPAPLSPPRDSSEAERLRVGRAAALLGGPVVVDRGWGEAAAGFFEAPVVPVEALLGGAALTSPLEPAGPALIQLSSGSTGSPRGVVLPHAALLANVAQLAARVPFTDQDVVLSWMPHTHDMGLIGCHILPLWKGAAQVRMHPLDAMRDPRRWLAEASARRATVLSATPFALQRASRALRERPDLSSVRLVAVGAEPIDPGVCRTFCAATGLPVSVIYPMYGLAEATVGVAAPVEGGLRESPAGLRIGPPLDGVEVDIRDGELWARGPNLGAGYWRDAESTAATWVDGWLRTGDLAELVEGELVITGRRRDLVIVNGANHHAHDLEARIEAIEGVRSAVVVATRVDGVEAPVALVVWQGRPTAPILWEARRVLSELTGGEGRAIPVHRIPRTTSGKKRRAELAAALASGELDPAVGDTLDRVLAALSEASGRSVTEPEARLSELGLGSIQAMDALSRLEAELGASLDAAMLRRSMTPLELARAIEQGAPRPPITGQGSEEPIAIVGISLRLPGADTASALWETARAGGSRIGPPPAGRFRGDFPWTGAFLDEIGAFDAARWRLDPEEAGAMDPVQRLCLELADRLLAPVREERQVGVFLGLSGSSWPEILADHLDDALPPTALPGALPSLAATRLSQHLDLTGPAMVLDTACSSALVAVSLGIDALRRGACRLAVVGGAHLNLRPTIWRLFAAAGALSASGRCQPMTPGADGTVPGEGAVLLLLEPVSAARAAGRPVWGLIRGLSINNDGASLGVMAPNPAGQAAVIAGALAAAGVGAEQIAVVEAHAAGTPIGDPVERGVLSRAYPHAPPVLASKAVFGHTMAAAGAVGLVRLLGELTAGQLGAVSSFGFGGTNAHAIVEGGERPVEAPPTRSALPTPGLGEASATGLLHRIRRDPGGGLVWSAVPDGMRPGFEGGTYAITGGAGGIGAALARHLARRGARRLVLVGRRAPGPATEALCNRLGGLGASASYEAVDLADSASAAAWVSRLGRVDGVFHLAGGRDADALRAKVEGALALRRADAGFVVLFSSISACLPGMDRGIEDYAAANAELDRIAAAERAAGRAWTSLAFGPWASVGMAAGLAEGYRLAGLTPLRPAEGLAALERALTLPDAHLVVMRRSSEPTTVEAAPDDLRDLIRALVAGAAGVELADLRDDAPLASLGIDSVEALDIVKSLERQVGRALPTTLLFEHDTVDALVLALSAGARRELAAPPAPVQAAPLPDGAIPLIPAQQTFVVQRAFFPDMPGNVLLAVTVTGPEARLDRDRLALALKGTAERHPVLGAVIAARGGGHALLPGRCPPELRWVEHVDLGAIADEPFDLERGPLLRLITDGRRLVLNGHHSVVDAWSQKLVLEDLLAGYEAIRTGTEPPRAPATTWVEAAAALARPAEAGLEAWRARFADGVPPLILPWDAPVHAPNHGGGRRRAHTLDAAQTEALTALARASGVSLPALVLSLYLEILARWSGQPDVVVRVAHARREARLPEIDRVVGAFADSLPVRVLLGLDEPIVALARRVSAALSEAAAGAEASSLALASLGEHSPSGPVGLTPAGFSFPLLPAPERIGALELDDVQGAVVAGFTRLALISWVFRGRLHLSWCAAHSHLSEQKLSQIAQDFASLVEDLLATPTLPPRPRSWSLPGAPPDTLHGRVLARCRAHPDRPAAPGLSYGQLDARSAWLANRLQGERIAVLASPSVEAVVGVLAVLRSGAAYVPLDPAWPDARIAAIAQKGRPSAVLCPPSLAGRAALLGLPVLEIGAEEADSGPDRPAEHCWVMFTSGSTGQPKGVRVPHRSVLAFHEWVSRVLSVGETDRFLYTASLGYGGSIRQIFSPLLHGAMTVPAPPDGLKDPDLLLRFIQDAGITVYNAVPALWAQLLDAAERAGGDPWAGVRFVLVGGEAVPGVLVRRWFERHHRPGGPRLFDLYGSTETLVNATFHEITRSPPPEALFTPIGRPRAGMAVYLLDEAGEALPPGERGRTGEIAVGGAIANDYFEAPEASAASFLDHARLGRLYRTGDLARRDAAGDIVYVGRADTQVQIRGNRVELGEIEEIAAQHPEVGVAVAVYEEGWLTLAVEPRAGADVPELRGWLEERLPAPMVPNRVVAIERVPRNPAGKVDRRAVAERVRRVEAAPAPVAATGAMGALASIWAEVLELRAPPAADADFFALGGDSLRAVAVADRVRSRLGLELRPLLIYQHRRLDRLTEAIGEAPVVSASAPTTTLDAGPWPLTAVQRGFYTAHRRRPDRPPVWCAAVPLRGHLDQGAFRAALDLLVARHEQLRTLYRATRRGPLQEPVPTAPFALQYDDLAALPPAVRERALASRWEEESEARFDLGAWPLFRVRLCRVGPAEHTLMLSAHHITSDAFSFWLLAGELIRAHDALARGRAPELPPPVQLRAIAAEQAVEKDDGFWRSYLENLCQIAAPDEPMRAAHLDLGWGALDGLRSAARARATSPYVLVLTALFQALAETSGAEDLVVATALSGRAGPEHPSARVVGALARGLPVRVRGQVTPEAVAASFAAVAAHEASDPAEIAGAVGGADALERLGRYFLTWLDPAALPLPSGGLALDWPAARFRFAAPSTGTELMVGALAAGGTAGLSLNLHGGALVERIGGPLSEKIRTMAAPEAALVVYAPQGVPVPVSEPTMIERVDAGRLRSELVLLPWSADALVPGPALDAATDAAIRASDARIVALAGMLPALTGLGTRPMGRPDQLVTTGHAATVVAMVRTVARALRVLGLRWSGLKVGVLGYGSIGRATLDLARHVFGEPAGVLLSDPRVPGAADDLYAADLILGATSGGVAIDVEALRPGVVLIDDSFPRAFDEAAARARMASKADVWLLGGGMIDAGPLDRRSPWPEAAALRARYGAAWLPGCHAEAMLIAAMPGLGATVGPVELARALTIWDAIEAQGWDAAPLHLGQTVVER